MSVHNSYNIYSGYCYDTLYFVDTESVKSDAGLGSVETLRQLPKKKLYWSDREIVMMWQLFQKYIEDKDKTIPSGTMRRALKAFPGRTGPVVRSKMQSMQKDFSRGKINFPSRS